MKRYPNGIHGEYFFQKNTPDNYPSWLRTELVDKTRFIICDDKQTLLYLANLGCIDQNPWMSRIGTLHNPDFILMDIDPFECEFGKVVEAALLVKEKLDAIGLTLVLATSTTLILIALATPLAWWLSQTQSRWRAGWRRSSGAWP